MEVLVIIVAILTLVNVGITALCLKLYTEYFKDRAISGRKQLDAPEYDFEEKKVKS